MKTWNIQDLTGYQPISTYYEDFSIADMFGVGAVKDTFKRAISKDGYAISDYKVLTEFVMVLNWKIWEHYESNQALAAVYNELWIKAEKLVFKTFNDDEMQYYFRVTD